MILVQPLRITLPGISQAVEGILGAEGTCSNGALCQSLVAFAELAAALAEVERSQP